MLRRKIISKLEEWRNKTTNKALLIKEFLYIAQKTGLSPDEAIIPFFEWYLCGRICRHAIVQPKY